MDAPNVKPVNRGRLSKVELKKRKAERNAKYYDKHFIEIRAKALSNYHRKRAELKAAEAAELKTAETPEVGSSELTGN